MKKKSPKQLDREITAALGRKSAHATRKPRRDAKVVGNGQGNFLDPPDYPSHTHHVQTDLRRRPDNRGSLSLTYAVEEAPWLDPETRGEAKMLIDKWKKNPPAVTAAAVQDWIHQTLGYFRNAYKGVGDKPWNASNLVFDEERDPIVNADLHAGVRSIRKFYPEFEPTKEDFARAYWGKR